MNIEKLSNNHIEELYNFLSRNHFHSEHFNPHPFTLDYLVWLIVKRTKDFYCVMLDGRKVIAYGMLRGFDEGYKIPSLGISVDEEFRGKGIGKFMCQYLHFIASQLNCEKVRLRVHKDNLKAQELYKNLGYEFRDFDEEYFEGFLEL